MEQETLPLSDIMESILRNQKIAQDAALRYYKQKCKNIEETYKDKCKQSHLQPGDIVYLKVPVQVTDKPNKFKLSMKGPYILHETFPKYSTVRMKSLVTNKMHPHLVNYDHLKKAMFYQGQEIPNLPGNGLPLPFQMAKPPLELVLVHEND